MTRNKRAVTSPDRDNGLFIKCWIYEHSENEVVKHFVKCVLYVSLFIFTVIRIERCAWCKPFNWKSHTWIEVANSWLESTVLAFLNVLSRNCFWLCSKYSRLYSVHMHCLEFFANCNSCLTTYFHKSQVWQLYAHNLLMSISKHTRRHDQTFTFSSIFIGLVVNKSLSKIFRGGLWTQSGESKSRQCSCLWPCWKMWWHDLWHAWVCIIKIPVSNAMDIFNFSTLFRVLAATWFS